MGKSNKQVVLKRVFEDISNISNVIANSKKLKRLYIKTDFENHTDAAKIIESTREIIVHLKDNVTKISDYFDENYNAWQSEVDAIRSSENCNDTDDAYNAAELPVTEESENVPNAVNGEGSLNELTMETTAEAIVVNTEGQNESEANDVDKEKEIEDGNDKDDEVPDQNADTVENVASKETDNVQNNHKDLQDTESVEVNNETTEHTNENDTEDNSAPSTPNENGEDNDAAETLNEGADARVKKESKSFLKVIDINKLKAPPVLEGNDSILVISDSETENNNSDKNTARNKKLKKLSSQETLKDAIQKISQEITISKLSKGSAVSNTKDPLTVVDISNSNSSDSELEDSTATTVKTVRRSSRGTRPQKLSLTAKKNDNKFGYKAYVRLPRYPCEKLKELYLKKMDFDEVMSLTDLSSLKKRKRTKDHKESDNSSVANEKAGRKKRKMKRKRRSSQSSDSSKDDISNTNVDSDISLPTNKSRNTDEINNAAGIVLNDDGSATDAPTSSDEKHKRDIKKSKDKKDSSSDTENSKNKKKKKSEDDSSDDSGKKKKSKWRNDKLLKKNILESGSESEDEFDKFKRKREEIKSKVKTRLTRSKMKRLKKVVDSDSDSDSNKKKENKKSDTSEQSSSSSSSSDSEADWRAKKNTTKKRGGRIKKTVESSSDEDKRTRKSIRKVLAHESLQETTKQAEKEERERKARIAERQKKYNSIFDADKPADATIDKLVLDFDEESKEELISLHKDLVVKLKPHQAKGIQFMWDACFESLERIRKTNGSGCILAHCMGLGKTLQVIGLIHTLIMNKKKTKIRRVLVICPLNTVLNWVDEFKKWLSDVSGPAIEVFELVTNRQASYRKYIVDTWSDDGGVLIIGYDLFRNLTNPNNKRIRKSMRESFQAGLVDPGPDLVICDEGHLLKNEKTHLSVAVSRIRSERRIVLTGTPMQNNLKEYYCMVQFVKPNLLGTFKEYLNRFVNPITNGQYTDSTAHDISIMKKRSHVLHTMLDGLVQRKDYNVLAPFLPPKYEYVLFIRLSEIQIKLYQHYMDNFARTPVESKSRKTAFLFSDFQEFQRICTHPRVLLVKTIENRQKALFRDDGSDSEGSLQEFIDDGSDKTSSSSSSSSSSGEDSDNSAQSNKKKSKNKSNAKDGKPAKRMTRTAAAAAEEELVSLDDDNNEFYYANEWWRQIVTMEQLNHIELGGKLLLLFEILQQCELIGDKLLIFSQSLYSLNIIEYFLRKIDDATQDNSNEKVCGFSGSWSLGLDYFRIDGSSSCDDRAAWCKSFNNLDNHRARLFLISTKAGGLGINLVGANRVVIFDVSWNPSHDTQSIYRVYRFGQLKPCYIYRFVTWGTMEMKIYERQVTKQAISKRVIDEQQIDRHYNQNDLAELYKFDPNPEAAPTPLLPKDVLLAELLQQEKFRIYKYHEHQTLLENKEEEELDEAERKAAWEEFENEKLKPTVSVTANTASYTGQWIRNLPVASITAALLQIIQRDNPTWTTVQVQAVIPLVVEQLRGQVDAGELLLFNRIVEELRAMQVQQQQRLQQYYMQQQIQMAQQQQQQQQLLQSMNSQNAGRKVYKKPGLVNFKNLLGNALNPAAFAKAVNPLAKAVNPLANPTNIVNPSAVANPTNSDEIVDLND